MEYKDIVSEIVLLINSGDSSLLNRPLEEDYLLGYYLQRRELYTSNKSKEEK